MRWRFIRRLLLVAVFLAVFFWKRKRLAVRERTEEVGPKDKDRAKIERLEELLSTFDGTYGVYVERLGDAVRMG